MVGAARSYVELSSFVDRVHDLDTVQQGFYGLAYLHASNPQTSRLVHRLLRMMSEYYRTSPNNSFYNHYLAFRRRLLERPNEALSTEDQSITVKALHRFVMDLGLNRAALPALRTTREIILSLCEKPGSAVFARKHPEISQMFLEITERQMRILVPPDLAATFSVVQLSDNPRTTLKSIEPGRLNGDAQVRHLDICLQWKDNMRETRQVPCKILGYRYGAGRGEEPEREVLKIARDAGSRLFNLPEFECISIRKFPMIL